MPEGVWIVGGRNGQCLKVCGLLVAGMGNAWRCVDCWWQEWAMPGGVWIVGGRNGQCLKVCGLLVAGMGNVWRCVDCWWHEWEMPEGVWIVGGRNGKRLANEMKSSEMFCVRVMRLGDDQSYSPGKIALEMTTRNEVFGYCEAAVGKFHVLTKNRESDEYPST
ncbi:unnamed protein product [Larinioides sclopetarius]